MNPYRKAALFLIRMVAFGFIVFSLFQFAFYFAATQSGKKIDDSMVWMVLKSLPLLIGLMLLFTGPSIAKKLTEDFDE